MAWTVNQRRQWLFPPMRGEIDGIDLQYLDPADPDDRHVLILSEHPQLAEALEHGYEEITLDGQVMSPMLHITMHQVVANQIWDGEPDLTWQTAERLTGLGYERHEVLHMLASVVVDEIWHAQQGDPHQPDRMEKGLRALPDSWE